jgi:hypothetical protein
MSFSDHMFCDVAIINRPSWRWPDCVSPDERSIVYSQIDRLGTWGWERKPGAQIGAQLGTTSGIF